MKPSSTRRLVWFGKYPAPHFLFWPLSLVWGGNAFHFSCLLSDMICERRTALSMPTFKIYIPGDSGTREMVFSTPKDNKGEYLKIIILVIKLKALLIYQKAWTNNSDWKGEGTEAIWDMKENFAKWHKVIHFGIPWYPSLSPPTLETSTKNNLFWMPLHKYITFPGFHT